VRPAILVVPCYNEEKRIDVARFVELSRADGLRLLFVNDGSKDGTEAVLDALVSQGKGRIERLSHQENRGKAEAVRTGLVAALDRGAEVVAYADSDLATPPHEILRLLDAIDRPGVDVVLGSRVGLAGTNIERKLWRHMAGRVFATMASAILRARFYDTQCGAKVFRSTDLLRAALRDPFHSRWAFDVELIGRLLTGVSGLPGIPESAFVEVPLEQWIDVHGSKLSVTSMAKVLLDLAAIHAELDKRRKRS
jgi:glycosyltransferase involved in cell wall biosynthesis